MHTIALVSCVKKKLDHSAKAEDLYQSQWFKAASQMVKNKYSEWYILSAKHHLLDPSQIVDPYDMTLHGMSRCERQEWAGRVFAGIGRINPRPDLLTIFAGKIYRLDLLPLLMSMGYCISVPMAGMGIGKQLQWFKNVSALPACR
jgi:hypothetical protein